MSSAVQIQIVNPSNLGRIERYMNASSYQQNLEYSSNFNTQLTAERRLRLPFFDQQTGVAQNHCSLFVSHRQRMPGFRTDQIYSYPASRWRKRGRQYLKKMFKPFATLSTATNHHNSTNHIKSGNSNSVTPKLIEATVTNDIEIEQNGSAIAASIHDESSSLGGTNDTSDSKDSQSVKEELPKEWFYDEMDMTEIEALDDPKSPADDEYDYDPRYGAKKRKPGRRAKGAGAKSKTSNSGDPPRKGRPPGGGVAGGKGRGRRKGNKTAHTINPPSPSMIEPPTFEMAAAAVEHVNDDSCSDDFRGYRHFF